MLRLTYTLIIAVTLIASNILPAQAAEPDLSVWAVDPLIKVFPDAQADSTDQACSEVARGEHATIQLVIKSQKPATDLKLSLDRLVLLDKPRDAKPEHATLTPDSIRFVGYVPISRPTPNPDSAQLRKPPADYPDPLLKKESIDLPANSAQPVWITIAVPATVLPGTYTATAAISCTVSDRTARLNFPVSVKVYPVTVGPSRLHVTNWFFMRDWPLDTSPEKFSPAYWDLLRTYARNMAAHRQNVAWANPIDLTKFYPGPDGKLAYDFANFDRWIQILTEEGVIGRIEGGHIGGREAGWNSQFVANIRTVENNKVVSKRVAPDSKPAKTFYADFFPALVSHLKEKDWLKIYCQHLADEPTAGNIETYRQLAALAREYAPELKIIEACHTKDLAGSIDIWVPQLNFFHTDHEYYKSRQQAGEEVWFYTCMHPQGDYANRFIEQPLIKTRLLHWINFHYGATGYLHWGYNHWNKTSPYEELAPLHPSGLGHWLPAGDSWIVYPSDNGPIDSIRFEAMRDGIADYELLSMLADKNPAAAKKLSAQHIKDFKDYDTSVTNFRKTRRKLLEQLSSLSFKPENKTDQK